MLFTKLMAFRERAFRLKMPIAVILPSRVEAVAAIKAMVTVLISAFISEWLVPVVNSDEYSFVENPVQLPSTFASVKE